MLFTFHTNIHVEKVLAERHAHTHTTAQTPTEFWVISSLPRQRVCFHLRVTDSKTPVKLYIPRWGGKESETEGEHTPINAVLCVPVHVQSVCLRCVAVLVPYHAQTESCKGKELEPKNATLSARRETVCAFISSTFQEIKKNGLKTKV